MAARIMGAGRLPAHAPLPGFESGSNLSSGADRSLVVPPTSRRVSGGSVVFAKGIVRRAASWSHDLEGGFGWRAMAERAKEILMERNSIDESAAFDILREHSRATHRKRVDITSAVSTGTRCCRSKRARAGPTRANTDAWPGLRRLAAGRLSTGGESGVLIDRLRVESVSRALVVPAVHRQS